MVSVIRQRQVVNDSWQLLKAVPEGKLDPIPAEGDVIVPLAVWLEQRAALLSRKGRVGVWLNSNEEPGAIVGDFGQLALVAVNFPAFGDGRGYSIGRLLRERYGYKGELRAFGEITRDHLFSLASCGFDSFVLRAGEKPAEAISSFDDFSDAYQASVQRPLPLFRRRLTAAS